MGIHINIFFTICIIVAIIDRTVLLQIPRPRGVSIAQASLYHVSDAGIFTCFDGLRSIQFTQVNDDYCDCADGSDEPGTSACPHGEFHCTNIGHRPKSIPSSRVNDGICDCCDTSDEYSSDAKCINSCLEMGQEEQKQRKSDEQMFRDGAAVRTEMVNKGGQLKSHRVARMAELNKRKSEQEIIKTEKEQLKINAEKLEAEAIAMFKEQQQEYETIPNAEHNREHNTNWIEAQEFFVKYDVNKDGYIEVTELQKDIALDKDRDSVVNKEEAKFFLDERDRLNIDEFVTLAWPRIKPYLMLSEGIFMPPKNEDEENNSAEVHTGQQKTNSDVQHLEENEDNENNADFENEDGHEDEDAGEGTVSEETTQRPEYDPETERIIELANEARNAFADIDREVREIESEIKNIENQNEKDYGVDEEFASMDGECYNYEDREYIYKLCPFDRASQQQRGGGSETTLGRWDQWNGPENNKYSQMKFSHGASCWNGPQRSAIVQLKCASKHKIISVTEPNRCEYHFVFETPAQCSDLFLGSGDPAHDEL